MSYTELRTTMIPNTNKGVPFSTATEREYIYFTVKFNNFRDVSGSHANEVTDREEIDTCECVICLPESYTDDGDETPLIISCHGSGELVNAEKKMVGGVQRLMNCVDAGYAVMDVNGSAPHGRTMGCPEHMFAAYKAYRYAIRHFNLSERVLVAGASMGGHSAMNFAHTFPSIVTAVGMFYPRLNMEGVTVDGHYCIIDIYRFPTTEWCERNTIGFNPHRTRSFINQEGERVVIPPCPIKIWQGTADTTVDPVITEEFVNSVRRSGSYIEFHKLEGIAHKITPVMKEEILMWFNRFI